MLDECNLCPHMCGAHRTEHHGDGFCGRGNMAVVARAALHFWEEPCISGTRGSGTVFFGGCTSKCVYCQNYEISQGKVGADVTPKQLADIFDRLAEQGAHNINLVTATQYIPAVLEALDRRISRLPVVYNTGGYERVETLRLLEPYVDVYLTDMKYFDDETALRYSHLPHYVETAQAAVTEMVRQKGTLTYDGEGMLIRGVIARHLILPGHIKESLRILRYLREYPADQLLISIMAQYLPCGKTADYPEINRKVSRGEYERVLKFMTNCDMENGFIQEREAAIDSFIPAFDLTGVLDNRNL